VIDRTTNATTRTATSPILARREPLLRRGDELASPETALRYRVDRLIGQGGYGQVYTARRVGRSRTVPVSLCVKVSRRIESWIREAYFGQLLVDHPRAIALYDAFVVPAADGAPLYCLALEYARHGDLSAHLQRTGRQWKETVARREIAGILQVLGTLHRGQLLHRDLTPMNVFVCDNGRLKLGDFGIVRQQNDKRGITARTLNRDMAPSDIVAGDAPKWQARDDVYQVGQLLGMLIKGDASARVRAPEVRKLPCSDHLKEIIYRCIGERRKRYESADELIEALSHPPAALKPGALRTLKGVHLALTGIFSKLRRDVAKAAKRSGATVHGMPSIKTTVVVRGKPNALQAAGRDAGRKLMEIKRLREKGHRIIIISEPQFWRLAAK
jgi:eukaryotic-like serine/threonine-protein kinase